MTPPDVQIGHAEASPAQRQAWVALWRRLLTPDPENTNAPTGEVEASQRRTVASCTQRMVHEPLQYTPR
jgi:hypothetical protein